MSKIEPDGFQQGLPQQKPGITWEAMVGQLPNNMPQQTAQDDSSDEEDSSEEEQAYQSVLDVPLPKQPSLLDNPSQQTAQEEEQEEEEEQEQGNKPDKSTSFLAEFTKRFLPTRPVTEKKKVSAKDVIPEVKRENYEDEATYNEHVKNREGQVQLVDAAVKLVNEQNTVSAWENLGSQILDELGKGHSKAVEIQDAAQTQLFSQIMAGVVHAPETEQEAFLNLAKTQTPQEIAYMLYQKNLPMIQQNQMNAFDNRTKRKKVAQKQGLKKRVGGVRTSKAINPSPLALAQEEAKQARAAK